MRCPSLSELPAPPAGRTGWPWTEEGPRPDQAPPGGTPWPRISIVTPSLGQGEFIEETIRSVLLQGYPDLEYVVMDGGSTDGTVDVIRKYAPWLARWASEPDRGQSHAINKGLAQTSGRVCAWLCSDDILRPGSLGLVGRYFAEHPDCQWLAGAGDIEDQADTHGGTYRSGICSPLALMEFWVYCRPGHLVCQPSTFWSRALWDQAGGVRESNHLAMDYELWLKFQEHAALHTTDRSLSVIRLHPGCKTWRSNRDQARELSRCGYAAARRRGYGFVRWTLRMLACVARWRLAGARKSLASRSWGRLARHLVNLPLAALLVWWEGGRARMLNWRKSNDGPRPGL